MSIGWDKRTKPPLPVKEEHRCYFWRRQDTTVYVNMRCFSCGSKFIAGRLHKTRDVPPDEAAIGGFGFGPGVEVGEYIMHKDLDWWERTLTAKED